MEEGQPGGVHQAKEALKQCSSCAEIKALGEFGKAHTCVDGHRSYCKVCHKLRKDTWRRGNAERHNLKCRLWRSANPEKAAEVAKLSNEKRRTSGKRAEYMKLRRASEPHRHRAEVSLRRRKLRMACPPWADKAQIKQIYITANKEGLTVDHVIPISHPLVCGLHVETNLQLLTLSENSRKQNEFMGIVGRKWSKK